MASPPRNYRLSPELLAYVNGAGPMAEQAIMGAPQPAAPAPLMPQPLAPLAPAAPTSPTAFAVPRAPGEYAALLARLQGAPLGTPAPVQAPNMTTPAQSPLPAAQAPVPAPQPVQRRQAEPAPEFEEAPGAPGEVVPYAIGGILGSIGDALAPMSKSGARPTGMGDRAFAYGDQALKQHRQDTVDWRLRATEQAEKQKAAAFDDVGSAESAAARARYGGLLQEGGLDPEAYSAKQIFTMAANPLQLKEAARTIDRDRMAAERQGQADAQAATVRQREEAKLDASSALSQRYREHMRSLFGQMRGLDPSMITDDVPYAELVDPNGAVQSALSDRKAMSAGGLRAGREGVSGTGAISTGSGDIANSGDAVAATIKAAFPRGAEPANLDARIRPILGIPDEQDRQHAINNLVKEGERMHGQLKQFTTDAEKWQKMKTSLDAVNQDVAQYKGDLPGTGIEALPTLIAQKLPLVGGEASMLDTAVQSATMSKGGRVQRGKLNMLNEAYKRTQSGAAIGLSEDEKFKVQDGLAAGASDEQVLEALQVFSDYFQSNWDELKAGNPEGAEMYERNLGSRKRPEGQPEQEAVNPETGETIVLRGGKWVPK